MSGASAPQPEHLTSPTWREYPQVGRMVVERLGARRDRPCLQAPAGGVERLDVCLAAVEPDPCRGGPAERPHGELGGGARDGHHGSPGLGGDPDPGAAPAPPPRLLPVIPGPLRA